MTQQHTNQSQIDNLAPWQLRDMIAELKAQALTDSTVEAQIETVRTALKAKLQQIEDGTETWRLQQCKNGNHSFHITDSQMAEQSTKIERLKEHGVEFKADEKLYECQPCEDIYQQYKDDKVSYNQVVTIRQRVD